MNRVRCSVPGAVAASGAFGLSGTYWEEGTAHSRLQPAAFHGAYSCLPRAAPRRVDAFPCSDRHQRCFSAQRSFFSGAIFLIAIVMMTTATCVVLF